MIRSANPFSLVRVDFVNKGVLRENSNELGSVDLLVIGVKLNQSIYARITESL